SKRSLRSARAQGVYGNPPSMFSPASKNAAIGGPSDSNGTGSVTTSIGAPPPCEPRAPSRGPLAVRIQSPERSSVPSDVRGGGASIITLPSASRGAVGSGNSAHCAEAPVDQPTAARVPDSAKNAVVIQMPRLWLERGATPRNGLDSTTS